MRRFIVICHICRLCFVQLFCFFVKLILIQICNRSLRYHLIFFDISCRRNWKDFFGYSVLMYNVITSMLTGLKNLDEIGNAENQTWTPLHLQRTLFYHCSICLNYSNVDNMVFIEQLCTYKIP